ncbi:MAG: TIGR00730 family Rossman fold protein [Paracoccaceae bacterium]
MTGAVSKSVCVFCGSRNGGDALYAEAGAALGRGLAENGMRLVYGAGDVGIMGAVARAAQAAGGRTFGVIPVHLLKREVGKRDISQFVVTEDMHERKKVMFMNSDAVVTLPGGPGSLDELFEVLTWRQLGLHEKPVFLLNVGGYWDPLLTLIGRMVETGFADPGFAETLEVVHDVDDLMKRLRAALSQM